MKEETNITAEDYPDQEHEVIDTKFDCFKEGVFISPLGKQTVWTLFPDVEKREVRRVYRKWMKEYTAKSIKVLYRYNRILGEYRMTARIRCRCCSDVRHAPHNDTNEIKSEWLAFAIDVFGGVKTEDFESMEQFVEGAATE